MKIIYLFIRILKKQLKINFKRPSNKSLVVFDGVSCRDLSFILQDFDYFVIENRKERIKEINFSFHLLILVFSTFIK